MTRGTHGNHAKSSHQHRWNPGGMISSNGYIRIRVGLSHPLADPNGYAYEHLVVWVSGGNLKPGTDEILHHCNEDKTDNRLENLKLMKRVDHSKMHHAKLTDAEVEIIRTEYVSGLADMPTLAKRFDAPIQRISKIIRGKTRLSAGGPISANNRGKKGAGHLLDGQEWNQFPEVHPQHDHV